MSSPVKSALVLLFPGVEEVEAVAPIDLLRRAGCEVVTATPTTTTSVTGRSAITLVADSTLEKIGGATFDALVLPGGPGVQELRKDPAVADVIRRHHAGGRMLAAICAAPTLLADAGLLAGVRHTAHPSVVTELREAYPGAVVVRDGRILTSRGAGTALEFSLALIAALVSPTAADVVAAAICHPGAGR